MGLMSRVFPGFAARRVEAETRLLVAERLYEAAKNSNYHRPRGISRSGNGSMDHARGKLRDLARDLDENHDIAVGILDSLVQNIIGTGITIEPMVRLDVDGELDADTNSAIRRALADWGRAPEVTGSLPLGEMQRIACRTWLRDGELLAQHVSGQRAGLTYETPVPYAIELIEADFLPFDYTDPPSIIHGVEVDAWGKPRAYHLYLEHPGDSYNSAAPVSFTQATKRVSADIITHLKFSRRIRQVRGVSLFHSVFNRLDDIRDYEESERIAARVAAAFCGYVKRGTDFASTVAADTNGQRIMEMSPGQIFTDLLPGEEVGTIGSNRPSTQLEPFRNSQLRAVAAGTGSSASTISRNYDGTYSAQRQELVETNVGYARLRDLFVQKFLREVYEQFVRAAVLAGVVDVPNSASATLFDAEFRGPAMPWIDPLKEVQADRERVSAGFASRHQIIRERGGDPYAVDRQIERDPFQAETAPADSAQEVNEQNDEPEDEEAA